MTDEELMNAELSEAQIQAELELKNQEKLLALQAQLNESRDEFLKACEDYFSVNGTGKIQEVAIERKAIRNEIDSIGKVVQTEDGNGSIENPYKTWKVGKEVVKDAWYLTPINGYLWQAIKSGYPSSEVDKEYFDVVGID